MTTKGSYINIILAVNTQFRLHTGMYLYLSSVLFPIVFTCAFQNVPCTCRNKRYPFTCGDNMWCFFALIHNIFFHRPGFTVIGRLSVGYFHFRPMPLYQVNNIQIIDKNIGIYMIIFPFAVFIRVSHFNPFIF